MILGEGRIHRAWNLITKDSNVIMNVNGMFYSIIDNIKNDMSLDNILSANGISDIKLLLRTNTFFHSKIKICNTFKILE